jgi:hypothetical protein
MNRVKSFSVAAAIAAAFVSLVGRAAGPPACDPDNGGIKLPQGFCAAVVAENVGRARHLLVAPNGDVFVSTQSGRGGSGGGIVALRDADGDGKLETKEQFGQGSATGIGLRNGYIYYATPTQIIRYKLPAGQIKPTGEAEIVAQDLPERRQHADKGLAFDGKGGVYVNFGSPSNACQQPDRQPNVPGQDPCPLLDTYAGIFRFDENKLGQKPADGHRYSTGMRQEVGLTWHDNSLWAVMHNRDSLDTLWPGKFTAEQNAEWPAEYLLKVADGANFGWPYCFYNNAEGKLVNNPEYGGDGKKNVRAADRCVPRTLGAERRDVLHRDAVSRAVPKRRLRRVPRIVESRPVAAGRLQRHVRSVHERQAGEIRSVRRRLRRQNAADEPGPGSRAAGRPRDGP